ncbi:MAG: glycosyltransferase family 2 protein [Patescibacteria group bacterium]
MKTAAIVLTKSPQVNHLLLESLSFVDEIVLIVDSAPSTAILTPRQKIYFHPLNNNFAAQRNFALKKTKAEWVLFVDDDEYVGTELRNEIFHAIDSKEFSGFRLHRQDVVYHQPLLHGETGKIKILRLARRHSGRFVRPVHETWKVGGLVGDLRSPLYHAKDHFVSEFISRLDQYGQIDSQTLIREGKPFSWFRLFIFPLAKFKLNYFLKRGFLDGLVGLFLAYLMAVQSLSTRIFQWENKK